MPRNKQKNAYITIGIPKTSEVYQRLVEESQSTGTSLAKLVPVKLHEYYAGAKPPQKKAETTLSFSKDIDANVAAYLQDDEG